MSAGSAVGGAPLVRGAGGVVFDERGRVLLLRTRGGAWLFPKGHIEPGESALEAAIREVQEESGVQANCPNPAVSYETEYLNPRGELRRITWFALESSGSEPHVTEELFAEAAFFPAREARTRLTYENDRELLRRVLAGAPRSARGSR